jgi:PAS domain S-box-containing protein
MSSRPDSPISILFVTDGGGDWATTLERAQPGLDVHEATDVTAGVEAFDETAVDCVVSGYAPTDRDGAAFLAAVRDRDPDRPFVLLADADVDVAAALATGITDYVSAAADPAVLATRITNAGARYRSERDLDAARERYDLVARASADAFIEWDLDANAVRRRDGFGEAFGYAPVDVETAFDWWADRVHPDDRDRVVAHLTAAAADVERYEDVYRFRDGDGNYAYVLARGYAPAETGTDDGDEPSRLIGVLTDITEQIEYLARFRELIEHSLDTISIVDDEWRITYVSPSMEQVGGREAAAVVGTDALGLVHPADRERVADVIEPLFDAPGRKSEPVEYRLRRPDGGWTWVESVASTPTDRTLIDGTLLNTRNVTERKEREVQLRKLEEAIAQTGAAVYMTDTDGVIEYVNPAFEDLTGYASEVAVGETPAILNADEHDEAYYRDLWETIGHGEVWEETIVDRRRSGEKYTAIQTIGPITDADGSIIGYVAIQNDVTDSLLDEQRVGVLNRLLRHNLRNGLNIVQGHVEYVADRTTDDDTRRALRTASERCDRLLAESEKARRFQRLLNAERYTDRPVAEVVDHLHAGTRRLGGTAVEVTADSNLEGSVLSVVEQAVLELVENAIQHTDEDASVCVEVRLTDEDDVAFVVSDTGPGLPPMERRVLEGGSETPLEHSQGLGLWLTHWLVQIAGGSIDFGDNDPGGTVISVRVPRL